MPLADRASQAVDNNALTALPDTICDLPKLKTLIVRGNALAALPEGIGRLAELTTLIASSNALEALPASVGSLAALQVLLVNSNKLRTLPRSLVGCTALKRVNASNNALHYLDLALAEAWRPNLADPLPLYARELHAMYGDTAVPPRLPPSPSGAAAAAGGAGTDVAAAGSAAASSLPPTAAGAAAAPVAVLGKCEILLDGNPLIKHVVDMANKDASDAGLPVAATYASTILAVTGSAPSTGGAAATAAAGAASGSGSAAGGMDEAAAAKHREMLRAFTKGVVVLQAAQYSEPLVEEIRARKLKAAGGKAPG